MKTTCLKAILAAILFAITINHANAEFVLRFGNLDGSPVNASPGLNFLIPVYGSSSSGTTNSVSDFSVCIDVGDSTVASTYFKDAFLKRNDTLDLFDTGASGLTLGDTNNTDDPSVVDFVILGVFKANTDFTGPVKLFDLQFTAPNAGVSNTFSINGVVDGSSYYSVNAALVDFTQSNFIGGSVQYITAVPEPSSLALVGACVLMGCIRRRRRSDCE